MYLFVFGHQFSGKTVAAHAVTEISDGFRLQTVNITDFAEEYLAENDSANGVLRIVERPSPEACRLALDQGLPLVAIWVVTPDPFRRFQRCPAEGSLRWRPHMKNLETFEAYGRRLGDGFVAMLARECGATVVMNVDTTARLQADVRELYRVRCLPRLRLATASPL